MREIKFRAWNKNKGVMCKPFSFDDITYTNMDDGVHYGDEVVSFNVTGDYELMQYTGLKDKNGKEIYEGDILRVPAKNKWEVENYVAYEVFFHDSDCADSHVGWQMNRTHFYGALAGTSYIPSMLPKITGGMEVIGNIYENPELLEDKK